MRKIVVIISFIVALSMTLCCNCYAIDDQTHTDHSKKIVLTFDDGPHPYQTRQIMDVLDQYGIKATFFVIGINAQNYPEVLHEVVARGHEIGNHTYTHSHAARLNQSALENQILDCEKEIHLHTGKSVKLFRPPEGAMNAQMRQLVRELGYVTVLWNLDTRDWAHTPPDVISDYIIQNAKNGDIILMHDYIGANSPTVEALKRFIPVLIEQGFTFVTAGELLQNK